MNAVGTGSIMWDFQPSVTLRMLLFGQMWNNVYSSVLTSCLARLVGHPQSSIGMDVEAFCEVILTHQATVFLGYSAICCSLAEGFLPHDIFFSFSFLF